MRDQIDVHNSTKKPGPLKTVLIVSACHPEHKMAVLARQVTTAQTMLAKANIAATPGVDQSGVTPVQRMMASVRLAKTTPSS
jgi:hypothetical protein